MPDDKIGRTHALLGDPVKRAILRHLLRKGRATPGDLAGRLQPRFGIGRSTMSNHITQLRAADLIRRDGRGGLVVADPYQLQDVLLATARLARTANAASARTIEAEYVELLDSAAADWDPADAARAHSSRKTPALSAPGLATMGFVQRDATLNAQSATADSRPPNDLDVVWVVPARSGSRPLSPSQPARYVQAARLVFINAHWIPFVKIVQASLREAHEYAATFQHLQALVELELEQILEAIVRANLTDAAINETLHERFRARVPRLEAQLTETLMFLRSDEVSR